MRLKAIYLPYFVARAFQFFCYLMVFVLDVIDFILKPICWLRFKTHTITLCGFAIAGGYWYITGTENAAKKAVCGFLGLVLIIALIKFTKRTLSKYRQRLIRYVYGFPPCLYLYKNPTQPI